MSGMKQRLKSKKAWKEKKSFWMLKGKRKLKKKGENRKKKEIRECWKGRKLKNKEELNMKKEIKSWLNSNNIGKSKNSRNN